MGPDLTPPVLKRPPIAPELAALVRRRRRTRLVVFITLETLVVAVTVAAMAAGISEHFLAETYTKVFRTVPVIGAFLAATLPILFFGHPKRRNRPR